MFLPAGMQMERRLRRALSSSCDPTAGRNTKEPQPPVRVSQWEPEGHPVRTTASLDVPELRPELSAPFQRTERRELGRGAQACRRQRRAPCDPSVRVLSADLQALPATGRPAPPPGPGVQRRCGDRRKSSLLRPACTPAGSLPGRCLQSVNTPFYRWIKRFQRPRL